MTDHFHKRVLERIGPHIDPATLEEGLFWAIENDRADLVEFVARVNRKGRRLFRFRAADGRVFIALLDLRKSRAVTVLTPSGTIKRFGGGAIDLDRLK